MAIHKSALKRARQNKTRRLRNMGYKTRAKKAIKEVRTSLAGNSVEQAKERFVEAISITQKAASKGVIHKRMAARKISRLARQINQLTS